MSTEIDQKRKALEERLAEGKKVFTDVQSKVMTALADAMGDMAMVAQHLGAIQQQLAELPPAPEDSPEVKAAKLEALAAEESDSGTSDV